jgi:hypothetical protein
VLKRCLNDKHNYDDMALKSSRIDTAKNEGGFLKIVS